MSSYVIDIQGITSLLNKTFTTLITKEDTDFYRNLTEIPNYSMRTDFKNKIFTD